MAYSDNKLAFKKSLLDEMYAQYEVFIKTGLAVSVKKDNYYVKYTNLKDLRDAMSALETEIAIADTGCPRRRCV